MSNKVTIPALNETFKIYLVRGVYEETILGDSALAGNLYTNTSYDTLVRGVDDFCSDYHNNQLWIFQALQIVSLEMQGAESEVIEQKTRGIWEIMGGSD